MPRSISNNVQTENIVRFGLCELFMIVFIFVFSSTCLYAADLQSGQNAYSQKDYAGAMKELAPLAQAGNAGAQVLVGKMYMLGQGVPKNSDTALHWFRAASDQGNPEAEFFLGAMYLLPAKDIPQGLKWLRLSAEQGVSDAQLLLGMSYLKGSDLPHDLVQADMWLHLAAAKGDTYATSQWERAEKQMSPDQVEKARGLAAAWKPSSSGVPTPSDPSASEPRQQLKK